MSRWVVVCAAALLLVGCAKELAVEGPQSSSGPQLKTRAALPPVEPRKWAVEGAVYDEAMDVWMAPKPEVEAQIQAQAGAPTHLALKIYPKTEAEQWEIESDEDVQVSYIPFGFGQLTEQERALVEQSRAKMQSPQIEVSPYTVTYTDMVSTDGGPTSPVTIQLPILYVVWPVSKPLPATIEYQVEREIVQPRQTRAETYSFTCYLKVYDDVVKRNIPLTNMKVQYTVIETGQWYSAVTASDGSFRMNTGIPISEMNNYDWISRPCTLTSTDSRWKIVGSSNTTTPYLVELMITIPVGRNALYYPNPNDVIVPGDYYNRQVNEIHRAANYFFNVQTDFPKPTISGGITDRCRRRS